MGRHDVESDVPGDPDFDHSVWSSVGRMGDADDPLAHWADSLASWAIPGDVLSAAPRSPWIHPVQSFTPSGDLFVDTPSRRRALEALDGGGSVLDVGCGGGRATFGLVPPATRVVGVDQQPDMLAVFAAEASRRGVECRTVLGDWPAVAEQTPDCDVVVCHHVFYNVADLAQFVHQLASHARRRVVVELPMRHPLTALSPAWQRFWGLERPTSPDAHDALAVVRHLGYDAVLERFTQIIEPRPVTDQDVEFTRIRLCLPAERDPEVRAHIEANPITSRDVTTIWWDS